MKVLTNNNIDVDGSFVKQEFRWTNGTVIPSGDFSNNITIGAQAETLNSADYDSNGSVVFIASDALYDSESSYPQRSYPDGSWNSEDLLQVDYEDLPNATYLSHQNVSFETRILLPSTNSAILDLSGLNTYENELSGENLRYVDQGNNLVCIKSGDNNPEILPSSITFTTTNKYHSDSSNSDNVTIFEISSALTFTNQSSVLEEVHDGSYSSITSSSASITANNIISESATDYRFIMNPKSISGNTDASFDFPRFLPDTLDLLAYDGSGSTYASSNKLTTLKTNMNILGNDIYSILNDDSDVTLTVSLSTNGTATNADSLKNYFEITYSDGSGISGSHIIEDLERIEFYNPTLEDTSENLIGTLTTSSELGAGEVQASSGAVVSMNGWKLYKVTETTSFGYARTQLYLGAYSNLYVATKAYKQIDIRYELRTAAGDVKPDFYLKYVNYVTDATRELTSDDALTSTVVLSSNDLKSHIGYIQYTAADADNDTDSSWENVTSGHDIDPNFDSENVISENGNYNIYIDIPKTYPLTEDQYMIRMQLDPASTSISAKTYPSTAAIFYEDSYEWDLTTDPLNDNSANTVSGLTFDYALDPNTLVATLTVKQNGVELFSLQQSGDITQSFRIIYAPRGIAETKVYLNNVLSETIRYHGRTDGFNGLRYQLTPDTAANDGIRFRLDTRYRDSATTSSYWTLENDNVTIERVSSNSNYYDLSGQYIGVDGSYDLSNNNGLDNAPVYGASNDGAKSVAFHYFRGNANGNDSTVTIERTPSTLRYVLTTTNGESTDGSYNDVYSGFSQADIPNWSTFDGTIINNFGLMIDDIEYSILSGDPSTDTTTNYQLYVTYDTYTITESNALTANVQDQPHNTVNEVSAGDFYLWYFNGSEYIDASENPAPKTPLYTYWCATVVKSPRYDFYQLVNGGITGYLFYSESFVGNPEDFSWNAYSDFTRAATNEILYGEAYSGIDINHGTIHLQRTSIDATAFDAYFVCPPPQLKITGVVLTPDADYIADGSGSVQVYNPNGAGYTTQSMWVDVEDSGTYNPFVSYKTNGGDSNTYYMNNISVTDTLNQSVYDYRSGTFYSRVNILENKFSIYEYSGVYMANLTSSPYHSAFQDDSGNELADLTDGYLKDGLDDSDYGNIEFNSTTGAYTVNIRQNKGALTNNYTDRYSYTNLSFTIGSAFMLTNKLTSYSSGSTDATRWVPTDDLDATRVMVFDFNVGSSTKLTLYGTNFSYNTGTTKGATYTLSLKKYSTNFGVDYSNFPREITSVYFYAKNKEYKQITFTKPDLTEDDVSGTVLSTEDANALLVYNDLITQSWSDAYYTWVTAGSAEDLSANYETLGTAFTPGKLRFELVPSNSHITNVNDLGESTDATLIAAGVQEILSLLSVTEDEPRNMLFMNLNDSTRYYDGALYGNYLPKTMINYSGQVHTLDNGGSTRMKLTGLYEKFGDTSDIYTTYGY